MMLIMLCSGPSPPLRQLALGNNIDFVVLVVTSHTLWERWRRLRWAGRIGSRESERGRENDV